jgi:hypothetical protein
MKAIFVPFLCAVALATMAGAGVQHWLLVRSQVASPTHPAAPAPPASATAPDSLPTTGPATAPAATAVDPELAARLDRVIAGQEKLMERLTQIDRQNTDLRDQVAETNRDLMELQFRVDSHSESFRPLRTTQSNSLRPESTVLPPRG